MGEWLHGSLHSVYCGGDGRGGRIGSHGGEVMMKRPSFGWSRDGGWIMNAPPDSEVQGLSSLLCPSINDFRFLTSTIPRKPPHLIEHHLPFSHPSRNRATDPPTKKPQWRRQLRSTRLHKVARQASSPPRHLPYRRPFPTRLTQSSRLEGRARLPSSSRSLPPPP